MPALTTTLPALFATLALLIPLAAVGQQDFRSDEDRYGPDEGDLEFTLSASGANDNNFDAGEFALSTSLGVFLTEGLEAGARHSMTFFDSDAVDARFAAVTRAFMDYHFDLDAFQPFLGANIGLRYGNGEVDETGTVAPEAGVKFFAREKTFVMAMAEYQIFFDKISDADDRADDGEFVYTVGIGFLF